MPVGNDTYISGEPPDVQLREDEEINGHRGHLPISAADLNLAKPMRVVDHRVKKTTNSTKGTSNTLSLGVPLGRIHSPGVK